MTVGFMRWLQRRHDPGRRSYRRYDWERCNRAAALPRTLFRGELATTALQVEHEQMIIEPTYCASDNVRMR
jgi:hypothetical protein